MREHLHLPRGLDGKVWRYRNPGLSNRQHHHAELELNQVTRGTGTYLLGGRHYQVRRGDLLWLFPAQEHVLLEQTPDFEMWVAVFRRKAIRRVAEDPAGAILLASDPAEGRCRRLSVAAHRQLEALLAELALTIARPALFNAGLSYAVLYAWQCYEGAAEVAVRDVHPAVERAVRLIRESPEHLPLVTIARQAGLSPQRLSRLFHQQTGLPMVTFRNREHVARFLALYGSGQRHTMLAAALEAGFGSYAQFHRVFKTFFGCSPADYYRQQLRP